MQVGSSYNINKELKDILDLMRLEPKKISVDTTFTKLEGIKIVKSIERYIKNMITLYFYV